jgi:hypothetical protein
MAQVTETELQDLKDLINGHHSEIKLDLSEIKGEIKATNARLILLETAVTKLDSRLWLFIGKLGRNPVLLGRLDRSD